MTAYLTKRTNLFRKLYTKIGNESDFVSLALEIFQFQYRYNPLYRQFCDLMRCDPKQVTCTNQIPFLPVHLFKNYEIKTGDWKATMEFISSATTGQQPSRHFLRDIKHYERNTRFCFESLLGNLDDFKWYGLLPNYLEQGNSSLVYMVNHFMQLHDNAEGGFYLDNFEKLINDLKDESSGKRVVLIGVSYALLDLAERFEPDLTGVLIIETGGMKGRGREIPKAELYTILRQKFNVENIFSEYGMTELMSQAYTRHEDKLICPPTMQIKISDLNDPLHFLDIKQQGRINIIDLANIDSCCFLATDDQGMQLSERSFMVSGRTDASELRGCNLLYTGRE